MRARRAVAGFVAALAGLVVLTGCTQTVEGSAARAGAGDVPRNNDSQRQYPNLLKECDVLTDDDGVMMTTFPVDGLTTQPRGSCEAAQRATARISTKAV